MFPKKCPHKHDFNTQQLLAEQTGPSMVNSIFSNFLSCSDSESNGQNRHMTLLMMTAIKQHQKSQMHLTMLMNVSNMFSKKATKLRRFCLPFFGLGWVLLYLIKTAKLHNFIGLLTESSKMKKWQLVCWLVAISRQV